MTPESERWERIRALFDEARALAAERRPAFLDSVCPDAELRAEVETLLRAHEALERTPDGWLLEGLDLDRAARLLMAREAPVRGAVELAEGDVVGRYQIVRRLGRGGMGVVYLARDSRLDRPAALKLLPHHLSLDDAARRRFEEEARAASALDHPNVATVYEIGDAPDGRVFIAMAFCEGETLRRRLKRGPLRVAEALVLAVQIADGLAAAHRRGIVHRDIKPENLIVTPDGVAKIVDFGIAKVAGTALTQTGATPGTVAYMSPEQTRGGVSDPRADVWALGAVLYEMLAGQGPFLAGGEQALVYAIRHDEPAPLEGIRPEIPPELAGIIERCLAKESAERYPDAGALLADLAALEARSPTAGSRSWTRAAALRFAAVLALFILLLGGAVTLWPRFQAGSAVREAPAEIAPLAGSRIAVLPLANESSDPEDAYLADAMTEELISRLSILPGVQVIAGASVRPFQDTDRRSAEIGQQLGVGVLLAGSLHKSDVRVRLSLALVDAVTQEHLWAGDYDANVADLMTVQHQILEQVAAALGVDVRATTPRRRTVSERESADAYMAYLRGRHFLSKHDERSFGQARDHFQRALDVDPTYAPAWSGLSDAYHRLAGLLGLSAHEAYPRARAAAERALALDPELAEAHASLANTLAAYYWDAEAAERHLKRAIELDPSYAKAYRFYATHLRNLGRFDEALVQAKYAQELDPLSASPHFEEAIIHYLAGRHDEALAKYHGLLAAAPDLIYVHNGLALNYAQLRRYDDALAALDRAAQHGEHVNTQAIRGVVYAIAGRHADARRMLARLDELERQQPVTGFHKASIHANLGEHDRAFELLEEAMRERTSYVRLFKVEPVLDPLRADPRFTELLRRVGLEN